MCSPPYDGKTPNIKSAYKINISLDRYYSYQKNKKDGETEKEYFKRVGGK